MCCCARLGTCGSRLNPPAPRPPIQTRSHSQRRLGGGDPLRKATAGSPHLGSLRKSRSSRVARAPLELNQERGQQRVIAPSHRLSRMRGHRSSGIRGSRGHGVDGSKGHGVDGHKRRRSGWEQVARSGWAQGTRSGWEQVALSGCKQVARSGSSDRCRGPISGAYTRDTRHACWSLTARAWCSGRSHAQPVQSASRRLHGSQQTWPPRSDHLCVTEHAQ